MVRKTLFIGLLLVYGLLFFWQEKFIGQAKVTLAIPLPSVVQKTVLGYLRQLGGEMHFIKTAVFIGGHFTNNPDETYANGLSTNFKVMTDLHPKFIDSYYLCQSTLAPIDAQRARDANAILQTGADANPDIWTFPFFQSFNYNHYLEDPRMAAHALRRASQVEGSPAWIEHLSSIRAAQGGDLLSGLIWLRAMHKAEENQRRKEKFGREIEDFQAALNVQKAVVSYRRKYGHDPELLETLIPEFLPALPTFKEPFLLEWDPPNLRLNRPIRYNPAK